MPSQDFERKPTRTGVWFWIKRVSVITFVTWHLFFLFVNNAKLTGDWSDPTIGQYGSYLSLDQGWGMFSSPVWKITPFLAVRIEFADGSSEVLLSDNEPRDIQNYFKTTNARLRKLEDHLIGLSTNDYRAPMWNRYAQWRVDAWFARHPDNSRSVKQVVLLKRTYEVPSPDADRNADREPTVTEIATIVLNPAP